MEIRKSEESPYTGVAEVLQDNAFLEAIANLERIAANSLTPDRVRSTFTLPGIDPIPAAPLPEALARYHEVGGLQRTDLRVTTDGTHQEIGADIFIGSSDKPIGAFHVNPTMDGYEITHNDTPLNMSKQDVERVFLSLVLPSHMRQLLESELVFNGGKPLDLSSPQVSHIVSQAARSRAVSATETLEYDLPATATSLPGVLAITSQDEHRQISFECPVSYDADETIKEFHLAAAVTHYPDLDHYTGITAQVSPNNTGAGASSDVNRGALEFAIHHINTIASHLRRQE